jgi:hypothetical protein
MPFTKEREYKSIEQTILDAKSDNSDPMWTFSRRKTVPSNDVYYRYILEEIHGGITHEEFVNTTEHTVNVFKYIESKGVNYYDIGNWTQAKGYPERQKEIADKKQRKLDDGFNITRKGVVTPRNYIAAFVGPLTWNLTHPTEDRFINMREALTIMGFPKKMEVLNPKLNFKDLTKSVPIGMAVDMVTYIKMKLNDELPIKENVDFLIQDNRNKKFKENYRNSLEEFMI